MDVLSYLNDGQLDTSKPTPLYLQIRQRLRRAIEGGLLAVGAAIPAERDIATALGVSRVTVRRAFADLEAEGLLTQRRGAGTLVAGRVEQPLSQLTGFSEDMQARGMRPRSVWLERAIQMATPEEAMVLNLSPGGEVTRLFRLRCADGRPLALELATIPRRFLADPLAVEASLYEALDASGYRPQRALQRLRAVSIEEPDASRLHVPAGSPVLYIERRSFLADGRVVEFTRSHYRGDSYDFVAELRI